MAVVQISRIQIRRGRANQGTGIPQLASGEMAWAVDTQELYIGSGSVSEGSPAVDNIKVITELDLNVNGNILNLLQYIYKVSDPGMQTGISPNIPTLRAIQDRLDDRVNVADFGAQGLGGTTDDTDALQRAIDQLFLNTTRSKASSDTADGIRNRIVLEIPAGVYNLASTLYLPSYSSLVGAGPGKSIINFTGTGAAIQFVNDDSTPGLPNSITNTLGITQPRNILIKDLTIQVSSSNQKALQLDVVKDSLFENLELKGMWANTFNSASRAIDFNVRSAIVTCENNIFRNITVEGFSYAVYTKQDILNNTFSDCRVTNCQSGFVLGLGASTSIVGQQYGPRNTLIDNCNFEDIKHHAVYIGVGSKNTIKDVKLINVGNNGAGNTQAVYPQIYIDSYGNHVLDIQSDRQEDLADEVPTVLLTLSSPITANRGTAVIQATTLSTGSLYRDEIASTQIRVVTGSVFDTTHSYNLTVGADSTPSDSNTAVHATASTTVRTPYVPEVSGHATFKSYGIRQVDIGQLTGYGPAFRLPLACMDTGTPWRDIAYKIEYVYRSTSNNFSRRGTLNIVVDVDASGVNHTPVVQLSDDYEYAGSDVNDANALVLGFKATLLQANGLAYVGTIGTSPRTLLIEYTNPWTPGSDSGKLLYSYTSTF